METPEERIQKLEEKVRFLMDKRVGQVDILPDSVKQRHIAEGVRYVRGGVTAGKPTTGESPMQGIPIYVDTTASRVYFWNGSAWKYASLT